MKSITNLRQLASGNYFEVYAHGDYKAQAVMNNTVLELSPALNPVDTCQTLATGWRRLCQFMTGAWSVVVLDKKAGIAYIMTDLLGRDQVYYTNPTLHLEFKTSVSECNPYSGKDQANELYFGSVEKFGYHIGNATWKEGVFRALPGRITIIGSQFGFMEYNLLDVALPMGGNLRNLVEDAFYRSLPENLETLTVFLSGGLDSSIMACLADKGKKEGHPKLKDATIRYITTVNGEDMGYAADLSHEKGFKLDLIKMPETDDALLSAALRAADSPIDLGSLIPNFHLFSRAPSNVILTGDGPDELLGGYARIHDYDSQQSDVFQELSYYHLPKLNQTAMALNKKLLCPYLDYNIICYALTLPVEKRIDKKPLKEAFVDLLPQSIIDRPKFALKSNLVREDKLAHRKHCIELFRKTHKI